MADPALLPFAAAALAATGMAAGAALRGWRGWLALQRERRESGCVLRGPGTDLAALRVRIRRLEAIASGTES